MICRIFNQPKKLSFFVFGPRQCGKTTLIESILNPHDLRINLLDTATYHQFQRDPSLIHKQILKAIEGQPQKRIFIDEIQRVPELLNEVQSLMLHHPNQFILTGSSARKLKRGMANLLGGRAVTRHLHPLMIAELGKRFDVDEVLRFGSLPVMYSLSDEEKTDVLRSYTETYLREEIQAEGLVRQLGSFLNLLEVAAAQCGEMTNMSAVSRDCGVAQKTVQSYYEVLEDTLVVWRLNVWRKSLRKQLAGFPKYYFFDTGVTNALTHRLTGGLDPVTLGHLFEQLVILETRRLIDAKQSEVTMHYWRTNNDIEVDLVLARGQKIIAGIEIKTSRQIHSRHSSGLRALAQDWPDVPLLIVAKSALRPYQLDKSITVMSIEDYAQWLEKIL